MSELTEYFLRHYTLIIDNTEYSHETVNKIVRDVFREMTVTMSEYRALSSQERADVYASPIGDRIITQIQEWFEEAVPYSQKNIGTQLASEIMIFGDSELEWALGDHYMPEPDDLEGILSEDNDDFV